jgi:hypothetical protein
MEILFGDRVLLLSNHNLHVHYRYNVCKNYIYRSFIRVFLDSTSSVLLKGLSHEIDFKNVDNILQNLA